MSCPVGRPPADVAAHVCPGPPIVESERKRIAIALICEKAAERYELSPPTRTGRLLTARRNQRAIRAMLSYTLTRSNRSCVFGRILTLTRDRKIPLPS
ncbi:Hypothetical protein NTJ_00694 [Nesidiocoris tenuis]|uniref:Uncharacterized protein n=1 Tax=Nesidiocoris tenuis TaxID=355587 RepID=A0ABN7A7E1_9HEMI|nr:Hypothetical protein NTJ_00694 [Nesidiocoris tenuis]